MRLSKSLAPTRAEPHYLAPDILSTQSRQSMMSSAKGCDLFDLPFEFFKRLNIHTTILRTSLRRIYLPEFLFANICKSNFKLLQNLCYQFPALDKLYCAINYLPVPRRILGVKIVNEMFSADALLSGRQQIQYVRFQSLRCTDTGLLYFTVGPKAYRQSFNMKQSQKAYRQLIIQRKILCLCHIMSTKTKSHRASQSSGDYEKA